MDGSHDIAALYGQAVEGAERVIAGIQPEQITAPTPCSEWDMRALLAHLLEPLQAAAGSVADAADAQASEARVDDVRAAFVAAAKAMGAAFSTPGGLDGSY